MVTLNAHFDGKVIVPDEQPSFAAGTRLRVTVEAIDEATTPASGKLELPLLTGVDPEIVRTVMEDPEFAIENAKIDRFLRPHST